MYWLTLNTEFIAPDLQYYLQLSFTVSFWEGNSCHSRCFCCCEIYYRLTPLSSSTVECLCLPLGFFTYSFSQEAWSSFSMLFPALITLMEKGSREQGAPEVWWFTVFILGPLTTRKQNSSEEKWREKLTVGGNEGRMQSCPRGRL